MKNKVLWSITNVMFMLLMIGCSAFDSESLIVPIVLVSLSSGWLLVFGIVNRDYMEGKQNG